MVNVEENMKKSGVAWFKFDENSSSQLIDSKGANVGTVTGTSVISGVKGNARSFNGTNDFITLPTSLIPIGAKSIRFKIRITSIPSTTGYILINTNSFASYQGFGIQVDNSGSLVVVGSQASATFRYLLSTGKNICDNQWHDILFTWDGTTNSNTVKLYVDDMRNPIASTTALSQETVAYNDTKTAIGRLGGNGTTAYTRFDVDELEIYNAVIEMPVYKTLLSSNNKTYSLTPPIYATETATPIMTGNTTPSGRAFASSEYSTTYPAWKAFNRITESPCWVSSNGILTGWLAYEFPHPVIIGKYEILARDHTETAVPKTWTFEGSNNSVNWTILDKRTNEINWIAKESRTYSFNDTGEYKFYRINITEVNSSVYIAIGDLMLFENLSSPKLFSLPNQSEKTFINHGMESPINIVQLSGVKLIESNSTTHESGKTFTHTVDLSKRRVDKILFS